MKKKLKANSRIELKNETKNKIEFIIDKNRKAVFVSNDFMLSKFVYALINNGIDMPESINKLSENNRSRAFKFVKNLEEQGFIDYEVQATENLRLVISPTNRLFRFPEIKKSIDVNICISKFTFIQFERECVIIQNPLSNFKIISNGKNNARLLEILGNINKYICDEKFHVMFSLLIAGNFVLEAASEDSTSTMMACWEFHDLLFHTSSRLGKLDDSFRFGATYRFNGTCQKPLTSFKISKNKVYYPFPKPSLLPVVNDFFDVLRLRKSTRHYHPSSFLSEKQIADFLYHTAFIQDIYSNSGQQDIIKRHYPSAGGIHEIEFYVLINRSNDYPRDVYYYHPLQHGLYQLEVEEEYIDQIVHNSCIALGEPGISPPVLVILTSEFAKSAWKYEKIAYRNTIKSVGAIYQTMYLVATAMGLLPCALGSGNPGLFAQSIGSDPHEEGSVGEFALGV